MTDIATLIAAGKHTLSLPITDEADMEGPNNSLVFLARTWPYLGTEKTTARRI